MAIFDDSKNRAPAGSLCRKLAASAAAFATGGVCALGSFRRFESSIFATKVLLLFTLPPLSEVMSQKEKTAREWRRKFSQTELVKVKNKTVLRCDRLFGFSKKLIFGFGHFALSISSNQKEWGRWRLNASLQEVYFCFSLVING